MLDTAITRFGICIAIIYCKLMNKKCKKQENVVKSLNSMNFWNKNLLKHPTAERKKLILGKKCQYDTYWFAPYIRICYKY